MWVACSAHKSGISADESWSSCHAAPANGSADFLHCFSSGVSSLLGYLITLNCSYLQMDECVVVFLCAGRMHRWNFTKLFMYQGPESDSDTVFNFKNIYITRVLILEFHQWSWTTLNFRIKLFPKKMLFGWIKIEWILEEPEYVYRSSQRHSASHVVAT